MRPLCTAALLLSACAAHVPADRGAGAHPSTSAPVPEVTHRFVTVNGLRVFYRETGPKGAPTLLLLHGFPSSSHQFRRLFDALGGEFHLVAPDYPGFGYSDAPASTDDGGTFSYTFDRLTDVTEGLCQELGLNRFFIYIFDFGAPVGFRLALRHPSWIAGIISQNGNAYEEGLGEVVRSGLKLPKAQVQAARKAMLTPEATRAQYLTGAARPEMIPPDAWSLDQALIDRPGRAAIMLSLIGDYGSNVAAYPQWQAWLRQNRPPVLLPWGRNDPVFVAAGARAYLRDVPEAELHLLDGGHFALEEHPNAIVALVRGFIRRHAKE